MMNDSGGGMVRSVMLTLRHGTTGLAEVPESALASKIEDKLGENLPCHIKHLLDISLQPTAVSIA